MSKQSSMKMPPSQSAFFQLMHYGYIFSIYHIGLILSYLIRIPCHFVKDKLKRQYDLKALIDTGARLCTINSWLVPMSCREPCTSLDSISTSTGSRSVEWQTRVRVYLSEHEWVEVNAVLHNCLYGILLGVPFLSQLMPYQFLELKKAKPGRLAVHGVEFTLFQKKHRFKFIDKTEENVLERIGELQEHLADLKLTRQLHPSDAQLKAFAKVRADLIKQCSLNPTAFWHIYKHEVSLPYRKDFALSEIPQHSRAIPMSAVEIERCRVEIADLLQKGMIKESFSEWACFAFWVNKHSEIVRGVPRLVVNYKPLNNALEYDSYPIPKASIILAQLSQAKIFSKFDCKSGFYQIGIKPEDQHKTAFTVPQGHYEWTVMPFGLKNAPSAFQRCMDKNFIGMEKFLKVYIDDILIFSNSIPEHLVHLKKFLQRCQQKGVVLSEKKMLLYQTEISFLGHIIRFGEIRVMTHSLEFVDKFPDVITDKTQLQRFLGCLNYISKFYPNCATDRSLLNQRLKKDADRQPWLPQHTEAVKKIKAKVKTLPGLHPINEEEHKVVFSDASDLGWGAVLCQLSSEDKHLQICQYASGTWTDSQQRAWPAVKKELSAVVLAVDKFHDFLVFRHFTLFSDCIALGPLIKAGKSKEAVIIRWLMFLSHYDFSVEHIAGERNSLADMLSREFLIPTTNNNSDAVINMHTASSSSSSRIPQAVILMDDQSLPEEPEERFQTFIPMEGHQFSVSKYEEALKGFPGLLNSYLTNGQETGLDIPWVGFQLFTGADPIPRITPYLCKDGMSRQDWSNRYLAQRNYDAKMALGKLSQLACISFHLEYFHEDTSIPRCCKILIKRLTHHSSMENIEELFFRMMMLQNPSNEFFYSLQFHNFSPVHTYSFEAGGDVTPRWFYEWFQSYGIQPSQIGYHQLHEMFAHTIVRSKPQDAVTRRMGPNPLDVSPLLWKDLWHTTAVNFIKTLRNNGRYPSLRWLYRPRMFAREVHLHQQCLECTQASTSLQSNPMRLLHNTFSASGPQHPTIHNHEFEIQHFTIVADYPKVRSNSTRQTPRICHVFCSRN